MDGGRFLFNTNGSGKKREMLAIRATSARIRHRVCRAFTRTRGRMPSQTDDRLSI